MDIMELGAIGELVGGVAVLLTLGYLAVQIRSSTLATRPSTAQAFADSINAVNLLIASNPDCKEAFRLIFEDPASMSPAQRMSAEYIALAVCRSYDSALLQVELGSIDSDTAAAFKGTLKDLFATGFYRDWWSRTPYRFTDRFTSFIERECLEGPNRDRKS